MITKDKIFLFWNIGKYVYKNRERYSNIVERSSNHYSYFFGNSYLFTRENIWFMEKFYKTFPVFYKKLEKLSWNQYKYLLQIKNKKERYFYFYVTFLFNYNYAETKILVNNNYYQRI